MKHLLWVIVLSTLLSSCSLGLVATHSEPPFICFKKKCREMAKIDAKNGGNKQNYQKSKLNKSRKKNRPRKRHSTTKTKNHSAPSF